ncbi:MAG: hypothetical protein ACRD2Z_13080 [Thermoanaerobaculia bacterium]
MSEITLDIPPIPVDAARAAAQALEIRRRVDDAGGLERGKQAAIDAILGVDPAAPASELKRLRMLYRHAYTVDELARLVDNTFANLGIKEL